MALGLKGKVKQIHKDLERIRAGTVTPTGPLTGKRDVTLLEYLSANFKDGCGKDGVFDIFHLYNELGVNPNRMTIEQLIDLDQDTRWLVPEVFRDAIRKGLRTSPFYTRLLAASEDVPQPQVNMPSLDLSDAEPKETEEGETISKGSVSYDSKMVEVKKQALGLEMTYESIRYTSISLLTIFLQDFGVKLGHKLNNALMNVLINGDQDDLSENAPVIGISNPTVGLQYKDLLYAWIRGSRIGRLYDHWVGSETTSNEILNLKEFKEKQDGTPQKQVVLNETLPQQSQGFVSGVLDSSQVALIDPRFAFVQLTAQPLLVEAEKLVSKQIEGTYVSITTGFAKVFRDASVIIDTDLQLTVNGSNDFPAYMKPII